MAYNPGILKNRVGIYAPKQMSEGDFGKVGGEYQYVRAVWAKVDWSRGVKALREGALDAYDTIMLRMNWAQDITRECRIEVGGTMYTIDSFHADRGENTIQITASELQ